MRIAGASKEAERIARFSMVSSPDGFCRSPDITMEGRSGARVGEWFPWNFPELFTGFKIVRHYAGTFEDQDSWFAAFHVRDRAGVTGFMAAIAPEFFAGIQIQRDLDVG